MKIVITISGDKDEMARLKRLKAELFNFSRAMRQIGSQVSSYYAGEAFASQGGIFGKVWKPLSPVYAAWKAKHYPGRPPLELTGTMRRSFRFSTSNTSATITNTSNHYKYHQSSAPRSKLPRRQMAGINNDVKTMVQRIIKDDINRKLRAA